MSVQPATRVTHSIKIDSRGKRSYEEKYLIHCTAGTTDDQALLAAGMPRWGDPYPGNPDGWQPEILDRGLSELVAGKNVPFETDGVRVSEPQLLNGSGVKATGTPPTPVYIDFEEYEERPFSDISLLAPA